MKTKLKNHKPNTSSKLINPIWSLISNRNFRNNQNYIISKLEKFKFFKSYYRTWIYSNALKIFWFLFWAMLIFMYFSMIYIYFKYIVFLLIFLILLIPIFVIFEWAIISFYSKYIYTWKWKKYIINRYVFKKSPKLSNTRKNFISFKK